MPTASTTTEWRIVTLDPALARGMGLRLRRFPLADDEWVRVVSPAGQVNLAALARAVEALISSDADVQDVYGHALGRIALFASRRADGDGLLESALDYAEIAFRASPEDPEVVANLAICLMTNGQHALAVHAFTAVLHIDPDGSMVGMRVLAARNALQAGQTRGAANALAEIDLDAVARVDQRASDALRALRDRCVADC